jgi:hypothetical protein
VKGSGGIIQIQDVDRSRQACLMLPTQEPKGATKSEFRIPGLVCITRRTAERAKQQRKRESNRFLAMNVDDKGGGCPGPKCGAAEDAAQTQRHRFAKTSEISYCRLLG